MGHMNSFYSIIRFVPDPVAEEFLNIGVVVWGDGRVRHRFLRDWTRVKHFSPVDLHSLRDIERWFDGPMSEQLDLPTPGAMPVSESIMRAVAGQWGGILQLTEARVSPRRPDDLLNVIAAKMLKDPNSRHEKNKDDRQRAVRDAVGLVRGALASRVPDYVDKLLHQHFELAGESGARYLFDVAVALPNEPVPVLAMNALSLRVSEAGAMDLIDAYAHRIHDVRSRNDSIPAAVFALLPERRTRAVDHAQLQFQRLGVPMLRAEEAASWSARHLLPLEMKIDPKLFNVRPS